MKFNSKNSNETIEFAKKFAKTVSAPAIISLSGDLGAGKTTFAKGFAAGLGVKENITSPTFTIMNEYSSGKFPLYHFDMYRLSSAEEAFEIGFGQYFDLAILKGIVLIEWAENTKGILPANHFEVKFTKISEEEREISICEANAVKSEE